MVCQDRISSQTFSAVLLAVIAPPFAFQKKADTKMASQSIKTPPKCTADFCLIPIGTPTASISAQIADVQRLMKTSGLSYSMHSAGTTVVRYLVPSRYDLMPSSISYPVLGLICIKALVD